MNIIIFSKFFTYLSYQHQTQKYEIQKKKKQINELLVQCKYKKKNQISDIFCFVFCQICRFQNCQTHVKRLNDVTFI